MISEVRIRTQHDLMMLTQRMKVVASQFKQSAGSIEDQTFQQLSGLIDSYVSLCVASTMYNVDFVAQKDALPAGNCNVSALAENVSQILAPLLSSTDRRYEFLVDLQAALNKNQ